MKFYQKTWFVILCLIFFTPVGLALMWAFKKSWSKYIKIALTAIFAFWLILFCIGMFSSPVETVDDDTTTATTESATEDLIAKEENTTEEVTEKFDTTTSTNTTNTNTTTTTTTTTTRPAQTKPKEPSTHPKPTKPTETTTENPDEKVTVYITKSGEHYHYENPCGNGKYYASTLAEAKRKGLTPCDKCVLH